MAAKKRTRKKKKDSPTVLKAKLDRWWDSSSSSRKEYDWRWFGYDLWVNGYHYARWDRNTQQIYSPPHDAGKPKVTINKIYTTLRGVRNYVLRNQPRAEVTPFEYEVNDELMEQIRTLNRFLDFLNEKLRLSPKLHESVWHALKYSTGFWQVLWDEDADDGAGEVNVNVIDPYDLYYDPAAREPSEARWVILAVRRNVEDLKKDSKYDSEEVEKIGDDRLLAASSLKARLLQVDKGNILPSKEEGTVIVRETWWIEKDDEGNTKIKIAAIAGGRIIRPEEDTGLTRFPFFRLRADSEPLKMYGQGWVKNLISPNKTLNRLESQLAEYNDLMNRGKWVIDKGSGVRVINNENGQIIEKKRGYEVSNMPIAPLSGAIYQQIENANMYIEDIGGAHEASLGRIPPGAKSGRAIEALQVGDANNMSELVQNLELFLEDVYEYILEIVSDKYQFARNVAPITRSGEREFLEIIGETADNVPQGATVVPKKNMVDIKISSWLAQTTMARQEVLKELYQLGIIDRQTVLEGYQIGAVSDIVGRVKEELSDEIATDVEAQRAVQAPQEGEAEAAAPESGPREAIAIIRQIINGRVPPPPSSVSEGFLDYIDQFLASPEAQQLDRGVRDAIMAYRDAVAQTPRAEAPVPEEAQAAAPPEGEGLPGTEGR